MSAAICGAGQPACRGACHRARIRATRWLMAGCGLAGILLPCLMARQGIKGWEWLRCQRIRIGRAAMDLKGAVALVTGGNGGLGQRICHALAQEGAHVAVMYARSREQAESVASELTSRYHINAQAFACDITDGAAVDRLIAE